MPESDAAAPEPRAYGPWVERWILPFVEEPTLWPILLVLMGHAAAFATPLLLLAIRERRLGAMAALTGAIFLTVQVVRYELRCRGRPAALCAVVGSTWLLSGVLAIVADRYGVF